MQMWPRLQHLSFLLSSLFPVKEFGGIVTAASLTKKDRQTIKMATTLSRVLGKEVHPGKQRTVNLSAFVRVREFSKEQHPASIFKVRQPLLSASGQNTTSTRTSLPCYYSSKLLYREEGREEEEEEEEEREVVQSRPHLHSILHLGSDCSSTTCMDESWEEEEELVAEIEQRLMFSDEETSDDDYDIFYLQDRGRYVDECKFCSSRLGTYRDGSCVLVRDKTAAGKAEKGPCMSKS